MNRCDLCDTASQCDHCGAGLDDGSDHGGSLMELLVFVLVFLAVIAGMSGLDQLFELPDAVAKWVKAGLMTALILFGVAVQAAFSRRRSERNTTSV